MLVEAVRVILDAVIKIIEPELHKDLSTLHSPVLHLDVFPLQEPDLHLDIAY